jgi:hypothetical protein
MPRRMVPHRLVGGFSELGINTRNVASIALILIAMTACGSAQTAQSSPTAEPSASPTTSSPSPTGSSASPSPIQSPTPSPSIASSPTSNSGGWTFGLTIQGSAPAGDAFQLYFSAGSNQGQTLFEFCGHTRGVCKSGALPNLDFSGFPPVTADYRYERVAVSGSVQIFKSGQIDLSKNGTTSATYTY